MTQASASSPANFLSRYDYTAQFFDENWAWEFLRRNPDFKTKALAALSTSPVTIDEPCGVSIAMMQNAQPTARNWGLIFFPDPRKSSLKADVYWCGRQHPRKLNVNVVSCAPETVDLLKEKSMKSCKVIHFSDDRGGEHLLLKGQHCAMQVNCMGLSLLSEEPTQMQVTLAGDSRPHAVASWLARVDRIFDEPQDRPPVWSEYNKRLRNTLVALDAHEAGLSLYDIASVLYGEARAAREWASSSRALKDKVRRFQKRGLSLRDGGYVTLLN